MMGMHGKSAFGSVNQPLGAEAVKGKKRQHCTICNTDYYEGSRNSSHGWDVCRCSNCGVYGRFWVSCPYCNHIAWYMDEKPEPPIDHVPKKQEGELNGI